MNKYNIYVWGAGVAASEIFGKFVTPEDVRGFIDNNSEIKEYLGRPVLLPEKLKETEFDLLLICSNSTHAIYEQCINMGLNLEKIYFVYRNWQPLHDINISEDKVREILGADWIESMEFKYEVITRNPYRYRQRSSIKEIEDSWFKQRDFIRIDTLEMLAEEIKESEVEGSIAELGVFKGEFSGCLNALFPDRRLWLFDTFESFDMQEFQKEKNSAHCNETFIEPFKFTNCQKVLDSMPHKSQVEIVKGYFPKSMENVEDQLRDEQFAFVSLDVDFEQSIYEGLKYFYPKTSRGGGIL